MKAEKKIKFTEENLQAIASKLRRIDKWINYIELAKKNQPRIFLLIALISVPLFLISFLPFIPIDSQQLANSYVIFWFLMAGIGFILINLHDHLLQVRADTYAEFVLVSLNSEGSESQSYVPKFCLYLRPFSSTGKFAMRKSYHRPWLALGGAGVQGLRGRHRGLEFETWLEKTIGEEYPLISLGEPLEHHGAGRVSVDDWEQAVIKLMKATKIIFLVPWISPGTRWEISEILSNESLTKKTIFIFPPEKIKDVHNNFGFLPVYEEITSIFYSLNKSIPEYSEKGACFSFKKDKSVRETAQITMRFMFGYHIDDILNRKKKNEIEKGSGVRPA